MWFRRQFLQKMWPIQLDFLHFIVCRIFLSSLTLCNTSFLMWLVQMISTPLQHHISKLSDLLSVVLKFQHHTKLYSKCRILLVSSLNLSPNCCENSLFLVECCFCHGNPGFNLTCTSCIICYHATQIVEILYILGLFLIYDNLYWIWLPWDSHHLRFFHIYFHFTTSSNLN